MSDVLITTNVRLSTDLTCFERWQKISMYAEESLGIEMMARKPSN